jgi:hypothetical protein
MEFASNRRESADDSYPSRSRGGSLNVLKAHLNEHQRRHIASGLRLLLEDLTRVDREPTLPDEVRRGIALVGEAARGLARHLGLTLPRESTPLARVHAVAGIWGARVYDFHAEHLRGYGAVDPRLGAELDPLVDGLQARLHALSDSTRRAADA